MRYWATDNPRELHQRPLHSPRVTVLCAILSVGIIGPWFFEENEQTVTVTSDCYVNMLEEFFLPRLDEMDFFLWGYLKSRVYTSRPQTLQDLKRNIQQETANIPINMLERVMRNSRIWFNRCIDNGGRHLPDMIFKTM
jgi:hypothetical protein